MQFVRKPLYGPILMKESSYKNFAVLVLMVGLMFTNVDRPVLQLAMQPIKVELALSER